MATASTFRRPTNDTTLIGTSTWTAGGTTARYDKVNEAVAEDTSYIALQSSNVRVVFGLSSFSVPANSTITLVRIFMRIRKTGGTQSADLRSVIRVGTTNHVATATINPATAWYTTYQDHAINPGSGATWSVDDINGNSTAPLTGFGLKSSDYAPQPECSQMYIQVEWDYAAGGAGKKSHVLRRSMCA